MGYSPWGPKELDMTERLMLSLFLFSECLKGKTPKKLFLSDNRLYFTKGEVYAVLQRLSRCLDASRACCCCCCCCVASVVSDPVQPHRRQPTRLPRPRDSPGKNTGVGCHFLLQCMKVKSESEVITRVGRPRIRSKDGGGNAILQMLHFYRKTCPAE